MNYSVRNLIRLLEQKGFYFKRANGSHHLYYNDESSKT
jgi:predicted RNA binding protein YcfA (HicA-like mRNA interferase family)